MSVVWYLNRWWNFYMSKDEENEINPMFIEKL